MNVIYAGSFDPFTKGHDDIVKRTLKFADKLVIAIGIHPDKHGTTSAEERKKAIERIYEGDSRISVDIYEGLTTDYAKEKDINVLVRGVRNIMDFEYEKNMAEINRQLTGIETILLIADPAFATISSSVVRELMSYGKDVTQFLP